jgi:phenylacetate-CoA ligase
MVIVRGVNLFPSAVEEIIRSTPDVGEFRVEVRTHRAMSELSILVEPDASCEDPHRLARRIENGLREAFTLRIPVKTVGRGTLPRFEMKARRWVKVPS